MPRNTFDMSPAISDILPHYHPALPASYHQYNIHVYTYNVGYVSELINNENGKIVENYNAHEMANSIYSFFKNC